MNILIIALNSKYSHTNLAVRYLNNYIKDIANIKSAFLEFTINQSEDFVLLEILNKKPEIVCFSCYIWNIEYITQLSEVIKKSDANIKIIYGGPEVSFEVVDLMSNYSFIDYVIRGEGEYTLHELLTKLSQNMEINDVQGIAYRKNDRIIINEERVSFLNLDDLEYPYYESENLQNKYVYYESSRGCPFNCTFCISSCMNGVRNFSMYRIKEDLSKLLVKDCKTIKFVDRTFNFNKKRAIEIIKFIVRNNKNKIKIHFEITAEILDKELIDLMNVLPVDMFQFEIGVQSTNQETLKAVNRISEFEKLKIIVSALGIGNNIHRYLDLIAGLPNESYQIFANSFNDVYKLNVEKIQLGFLKVLKGTKIKEDSIKYGIIYRSKAPYEVIRTNNITAIELLKLKRIEILVDFYYNGHYFKHTLNKVMKAIEPFDFFENFSVYWEDNELYNYSHKRLQLFEYLYYFIYQEYKLDIRVELLDDFLMTEKSIDIPKYLYDQDEKKLSHIKHEILNNISFKEKYFSDDIDVSNKKLINRFRLIKLSDKYFAYIYGDEDNIFEICKKIDITSLIEGDLNEL